MPNKKINRTDISSLGEFGLIRHLTQEITQSRKSTIKGIGDDAAVLKYGNQYLTITTDMMVEGIHFDLTYTPLKHLGYKAVITNLSDVCAMNAIPKQITVSLAISNRFSVEALVELYKGIKLACAKYHVDLIGGDTTSSNTGLIISITAIGTASKNDIVYRSGAQNGDILCVTGDLGSAYLGLQLLEREKQVFLSDPNMQPQLEKFDFLIMRQLKPEARLDTIELFNKMHIIPTAMIDISDGLASELFHICTQSGVGAYIEEQKIPVVHQAELLAFEFNLDPTTCALNGGEDYELLFTINPKDLDKIIHMPNVSIIGEMTKQKTEINLHSSGGKIHPLKAQGWQHFNK